ncbi:hypothetical protein ANO11243_090620 [Dothideomycetidae sp. 11243]|nr:hypothetical protein ANO11243_090620 [fungal sp. No.11243]
MSTCDKAAAAVAQQSCSERVPGDDGGAKAKMNPTQNHAVAELPCLLACAASTPAMTAPPLVLPRCQAFSCHSFQLLVLLFVLLGLRSRTRASIKTVNPNRPNGSGGFGLSPRQRSCSGIVLERFWKTDPGLFELLTCRELASRLAVAHPFDAVGDAVAVHRETASNAAWIGKGSGTKFS